MDIVYSWSCEICLGILLVDFIIKKVSLKLFDVKGYI